MAAETEQASEKGREAQTGPSPAATVAERPAGDQEILLPDEPKHELVAAPPDLEDQAQLWFNDEGIARLERVAKIFAASNIVPDRFKDKKEDCAIILEMAWRHKADPMMFLQGMYVVHGNPGMEAKLAIALANQSGMFTTKIQYEMHGAKGTMDRSCTAWAIDKETGSRCEMTVDMGMAQREGWLSKNGSKWKTIPEMMLRYRAATFMLRLYAPDVLYGMKTSNELDDIHARDVEVEVLGDQAKQIAEKARAGTSSAPAPTTRAVTEERPIGDVMADATRVEDPAKGPPQQPEDEEPGPATGKQESLFDERPRQSMSDEEMRQERRKLCALYTDLRQAAEQSGVLSQDEVLDLTRTTTPKLKAECSRLADLTSSQG